MATQRFYDGQPGPDIRRELNNFEAILDGTVAAAQDASTAATSASVKAQQWADAAPGVAVEAGKYSAKHWADRAQTTVTGGLIYRGSHSAASGAYPATPSLGDYYKISAAGTLGGVPYSVGDSIIYSGTGWDKIDSTDAVTSVAGRVGAVVLTKGDVGLGNVDNTSDANKPVSTATQNALNGKANTTHTHAVANVTGLQAALDGKEAALGFTPVQQGGGTGQSTNKVFVGWATDGSGLLCQVDGTNFGKSWPINVGGTAATVINHYASPAVRQVADIGAAYVNWDTSAAPAVQLDAPNSNAAYMLWRATRWGGRHIAAMHVYEETMTVTMSVGNLNNFIWDGVGNFTATGNVNALSDIRLKTDLTKIEGALEKVCAINGYTYTRKDTGARQTGVVAQELQEVLPEAVIDNGEHLAVAYGNIVGLLIEAIKELKSEVDQLEGK